MSKQRLVEANVFSKLFNLFIKAKVDNKEHQFIKNIEKKDPQLGKLYSMWNDKMDIALNQMKGILQSKGLDTTEIDKVLNKRY